MEAAALVMTWVLSFAEDPSAPKVVQGGPAPTMTAPAVADTTRPQTGLEKIRAENADVPVRTPIKVRNEMGNRFKLVEANMIVDGVAVAKQVAPKDGELARSFIVEAPLLSGSHVLTAQLVYVGRNVGPFNYLDDIRYRVESTIPFETSHLKGPVALDVVATEKPGATIPLEKKPILTLTATPLGDQPTQTARRPTQQRQEGAFTTDNAAPGLKPASTVAR